MKQGHLKFILFFAIFIATFLFTNKENNYVFAHEIPTNPYLSCVDNAVAPLNNLKDIQTFLNCNGFNPGPIDGLSGSRTDGE